MRQAMRLLEATIVISALCTLPLVVARAQAPEVDAARAACAADVRQYCAGVAAGGGRVLACLKAHRDQVSAGCVAAVQAALGQAPPTTAPALPDPNVPTAAGPAPTPTAAVGNVAASPPVRPGRATTAAPHYVALKRHSAQTKDGTQSLTAYTLLAPLDWTLVGGTSNKADAGSCFADLVEVNGTVKSADGTTGMAVLPQQTFRWADDPAARQQMEQRDRFDAKYHLQGCPLRSPMRAADFLRERVVWAHHADRPPVTAEPFPELEDLVRRELGLTAASAGSSRVEAARVRVAATSAQGAPIDEWWSAAIVVHSVPLGGRGVAYDWHAEQITLMQAPRGSLEAYDKLYRVMATSVRFDPAFAKWRGDLMTKLYNARAQSLQQQSAIVAAFQQHVVETIQGVTANMQRGSLAAASGADQLVRGVQTFRNPSTGRTVELSNLYDHAWSNGSDQYIVSDDPNFNPNGRVSGDWGALQLVRPQP